MNLSQSGTPDAIFRQSTSFCRLSFFCSILLPYIPFSMRQPLLLFTKFLELKECMSCKRQRFDFGAQEPPGDADALSDIFAKLSPFLSEQERTQFSQMQNMMQMLKLYQTFQELAPFMNTGGDAAPDDGASNASPDSEGFSGEKNPASDMLFSMLTPEQKEMFENLKSVMSEEHAE